MHFLGINMKFYPTFLSNEEKIGVSINFEAVELF
jgi:hypothetical protein